MMNTDMSKEETRKIVSYEGRRKAKLWAEEPPHCIFCGIELSKSVRAYTFIDLAHLIRKSNTSTKWSRLELFTMDENNGLAHRECHEIWDNNPKLIVTLHRHKECLKTIKRIDEDIYNQFMMNIEK